MDPTLDDPAQQAPPQDPDDVVRKMWEQISGAPMQPPEVPGGAGPISQHPTQAAKVERFLWSDQRPAWDAIKQYEAQRQTAAQAVVSAPAPTRQQIEDAEFEPGLEHMRDLPSTYAGGYGREVGLGMDAQTRQSLRADRQATIQGAVVQRVKEENPDWSPTQIMDEASKRMKTGDETAQGGFRGWLFEKALPQAIDYASMGKEIGWLTGGARALIGAGTTTAGKLARAAAAGAAGFGAHGLVRAPGYDEEQAATAAGNDPYSLWSRVKRAGTSAVSGAVAEGVGAGLLPQPLADNTSITDKLAHFAKGIPGRAAQSVGMEVAANPSLAVKDPATVLSDAAILALMPSGEANDGKAAQEVQEAKAQVAPQQVAEEGAPQAAGFGDSPLWAKDAIGKATVAAEPGQENVAAAQAGELAARVADAQATAPDPVGPAPSETASAIANETGDPVATQAAADLKLDPSQDAQPQYERDVAREAVAPGALESQADDLAKAAADNEVAKAIRPVQEPINPDPTQRWDPASVDALKDALKAYDRGLAVYKGTEGNGDDPRRADLGRTVERQKAEIDRMLVAHEGRTLDQVEKIPHDSVLLRASPGLAAVAASRPLPSKSGGITNDSQQAGGYDRFAIETAHEIGHVAAVKAAKRIAAELKLGGNPEIVDKIQEHGEDAAFLAGQSFAQQTPTADHNESWQKDLRAHVKKQVDLAVNSFGSMYAKHVGETTAAQRVTGAVDPATIEDKGAPGPDGNPERFMAEKAVLGMAAAPGGPLANETPQAQSEIAQAWLREQALAKRKAAGLPVRGKDIPGRTPYDIAKGRYVALWGEPKWLSIGPAERNVQARMVADELTPKVAAVHQYMKQQAKLKGIGLDVATRKDEAGHLSTDVVMKGAEFTKHLANTAGERRAFYSRADILDEKQWGWTQKTLRDIADTGEKGMTTRVMENALDLSQKAQRDLENAKRHATEPEVKKAQRSMSDEAKFAVADYLSGQRLSNKGEELPNDMRDAAFEHAMAKLPPEQQKMARAAVKWSDAIRKEHADTLAKLRPEVKLLSENYYPQTRDTLAEVAAQTGAKSVQESLLNTSPAIAEQVRQADEANREDVDNNYARLKAAGKPFAENLLHRKPGEKDQSSVDHDPYRAMGRYHVKMTAYENAVRFADYIDKEEGGTYQPVRTRPGDKPRDALARFTTDTATPRDAIRIDGRLYQMAQGDTGDDYQFPLKLISGGGRLDAKGIVKDDGSLRWAVRPSQWDPDTKEWKPRGEWRFKDLETRQGGIAQIPSFSERSQGSVEKQLTADLGRKPTKDEVAAEMRGGGKAHEARVQALRNVLSRAITAQSMSSVERTVGHWLKLTAVTTLAANPAVASHIATAGVIAGIVEAGPEIVRGMYAAPRAEMRAWLKKAGAQPDPVSSLRMLDPNAKFGERAKAFLGTGTSQSFWPMQQAHKLTRAIVGAAVRGRSYREWDNYTKAPKAAPDWQQQAMNERIKGWALRGITDPAGQREAYAVQQTLAALERTGTLIAAVTTPKFLSTPTGRVLGQFMRPAIQTMNTGMKMLGREPATGNLSHIARFIAAGALAAWLDRKLRTNVGWTLGPRVADLGNDWFGHSPATAFPSLNDPESAAHFLGDVRLPLQTPLGAGPILGTIGDIGKSVVAWMQGDDDTLGKQWWLHHNLERKLYERLMPGFKVASDMTSAFAPKSKAGIPFGGPTFSKVVPSGDPDNPWAVLNPDGRLEYTTTSEELRRKALLGSVGSNQTANALQEQAWETTSDGIARADKSAQLRRYTQLVNQYRATKDPKALEEATLLEKQWQLTPTDAERQEKLDALPPWARAMGSADVHQKLKVIYHRYQQMDSLRTSPTELLRVLDTDLHDTSKLSPVEMDLGVKMYRDLEARAQAAGRR